MSINRKNPLGCDRLLTGEPCKSTRGRFNGLPKFASLTILLTISTVALGQPTSDKRIRFQEARETGETKVQTTSFDDLDLVSDKITPGKSPGVPRYEVGVQFTVMFVNHPRQIFTFPVPSGGDIRTGEPGLGGRFTYNLTASIAVEAEMNFFPRDHGFPFSEPSGHMYQEQFGVKLGKRFERFGVFGKVRPGFVGFTRVSQLIGTHPVTIPIPTIAGDFKYGRKEYFANDVGGVVEFYFSRQLMARIDFGDTVIRYGEFQIFGPSPSLPLLRRPPETKHNFQFSAGVGFRF